MQRDYASFIERKQREYGDKFDMSDLATKFIGYYNSGERIEVKFANGDIKRGTVGVTTGWRPSFLLVLTRRSLGSSYLLSSADTVSRDRIPVRA